MALPARFLDELKARVDLVDIVAAKVKLQRRGRDHVGLCPFHKEKTPSFTVSPDKGFFYCFGCQEKGSAIDFVMKTQGLEFLEAVERLAAQAGMEVPRATPEDQAREHRRQGLQEVMAAAQAFFQAQLKGQAGARARAYLDGRGIGAQAIESFGLGYAPSSRHAIEPALVARGALPDQLVETGLLIAPDDGGERFDRFRDRVMFPIHDRQGRVIAFGGRAMSSDVKAKYLNSPETPLFHKSRVLYNAHRARGAAHRLSTVIVAEGYMDVIALALAGFEHAVAPLGTALTEEHMAELWRMAPEPVLCFDGDRAGWNAAIRAAERSLPHLKPGRSLRFAVLPAGEDPDSLVQRHGPARMAEVLAEALPLHEVLWRNELESGPTDTPERRAGVDKRLKDLVFRINDESVRNHYLRHFRERSRQAFGAGGREQARESGRRNRGWTPPEPNLPPAGGASPSLKQRVASGRFSQEELLVAAILNHPRLLDLVHEAFAEVHLTSRELDSMRQEIIHISARDPGLDATGLKRHLSQRGYSQIVDRLVGRNAHAMDKQIRPEASLEDAYEVWNHTLARHHKAVLRAELDAAVRSLGENFSAEEYERIAALQREIAAAPGDEADLAQRGGQSAGNAKRPGH